MNTGLKATAVGLIAGLLAIASQRECPVLGQEQAKQQAQQPAKQGQQANPQAPPASPPSAVGYQATVGWVGTGTSMQVRGVVSADRRYVTINAQPQATVLNGFTVYYSVVAVATSRPAAPASAPAPPIATPRSTSQSVK